MNWRTALALCVVISAALGCNGGGVGVAKSKRPKLYTNVVSLSPSTTEYLAKIGGGSFLVGRTSACDRPPQILTAPVVVEGTKPDYEKMVGLKPELVIYDRSLYGDDEIAKLKQYGFETLAYDPTTIADYADFGYRLGSLLGVESYTNAYIDHVYNAVAVAQAVPTKKPRVTILLGDGKQGYLILGKDGFHAHIIQDCGGTPVGAEGKRWEPVNIEKLIDMDPEIIYSDQNVDAVYADPRLQSIAAVKNHRVLEAEKRTIVRIGGDLEEIVKRFDRDFHSMPVNMPKSGTK